MRARASAASLLSPKACAGLLKGTSRAGHGHRTIQELATTQIALRHGAGPFYRDEKTLRKCIAQVASLTNEG